MPVDMATGLVYVGETLLEQTPLTIFLPILPCSSQSHQYRSCVDVSTGTKPPQASFSALYQVVGLCDTLHILKRDVSLMKGGCYIY